MQRIVWGALGSSVGLTAANFLYQALTAQDWAVAAERTWFQYVAIFGLVLAIYLSEVVLPSKQRSIETSSKSQQ